MIMDYTIGSLFDGSGGFPLAASLCGITPLWAAEVEPYPIAVTRSRFPSMRHLGSVTEVDGATIPPVDVVTFGSPCQDLSVAGKRAGLKHEANGDEETTRSGLFMEAVRIIKEMREATNGQQPRFALWENVPGAFSSNRGEDFRIVLEELIKVAEPQAPALPSPDKDGWPYADIIVGDGWSIAWRVFDAQYWGVPQRRRRIHLVADFAGECAAEVLFEREGVRGYFAQGGTPWQGPASDAQGGAGATDREGEHGATAVAYSFDSLASNSMKSSNPHSGCRQVEVAKTLDTADPNPSKNQGGIAVVEAVPYTLKIRSGVAVDSAGKAAGKGALVQVNKAATLATNNDQYLFQPIASKTYDARGNGDGETVSTLTGDHENRITDYSSVVIEGGPVYSLQGNTIDRNAQQNGAGVCENIGHTLNATDRHGVAYATDVGFFNTQEEVSPTLLARSYKDPHLVTYPENAIRYIVRRLTPTECARLQGFADWWGIPDHKDDLTEEELAFWLEVRNTHAAINGKKVKDYTKAQMLKWYNGLYTDSAEYKMWGNGIALPPALYVMQGINEVMLKEELL